MVRFIFYWLFVFGTLVATFDSFAKEGNEFSVLIKGEVFIPSPCKFNNDEDINIAFAKVGVSKVDGINFKQKVVIPISCSNLGQNTISINLLGTEASIGSNTLMTNNSNLGISIKKDSLPFKLNVWNAVDYKKNIEFDVVPVKINNAEALVVGGFFASATLVSKLN